jgi:DNA (cytosine-5)-methyltransferase 1
MRFGSVCSGIEAASVAWHPLGWQAAWLAEIEPFPAAVLRHHYPEVPNLGDMTMLPERILRGEVEAPDLFCGGTPCQAFSVAGLRRSLDDARGNLSLTFCEIADAIDSVRLAGGKAASIVFWENVPGVLSTADNAFGCFLAGLAGEDDPLVPPGGKWTDAGVVYGPQRTVAWRILDAQYFGLAQRRRRVFVVASAREGFDPSKVLFEYEGVRRDSAPSREAGEGPAPTIAGFANGGGTNGPGRDVDSCESLQVVSMCLNAGGAVQESVGTVLQAMQVRRLTPVECERLQGFPDGYTAIPWRGKTTDDCPDGPRYKALGNSWAVPVVRWIGRRINERIGNE